MSIVVWVPLTGLPSGLPALTGVVSGTPLPANAIAVPEGYDPADPDGLWDLFPTDQDATYAQSYTPIAVATPFNITEAIDGVTLSGGKVQMLTYSLATVATPIEGVTLSGGTLTSTLTVSVDVPAASAVVLGVAPEAVVVGTAAVDVPVAEVVAVGAAPAFVSEPVTSWAFVTFNSTAGVASGNISPTVPTALEGDLLVAHISYRGDAPFTAPSGEWTIHQQQSTGNDSSDLSAAISSGLIASCIRGASPPANTFTRTGGGVAVGAVSVWRPTGGSVQFVGSSGNTMGSNTVDVTSPSVAPTTANNLIIAAFCASGNTQSSAHRAELDPTTQSGATSTTAGTIVPGTWREIYDTGSTTGSGTRAGLGRVVKASAGDTGEIRVTASSASRHAYVVGVWRIV
jgi:hypothetical protein